MKTKTRNLVILLIGFVIIGGCSPGSSEVDLQGTQEQVQNTHQAETAVFETSVVVLLTERAPTVTNTPPPSSTPTETPLPTITATAFVDPWALQEECSTQPESCVKYTINNVKIHNWVYIEMTHLESGISGKFSIPPLTRQSIILAPGEYEVVLARYCGENLKTLIKILDFQERRCLLECYPPSWRLRYREY